MSKLIQIRIFLLIKSYLNFTSYVLELYVITTQWKHFWLFDWAWKWWSSNCPDFPLVWQLEHTRAPTLFWTFRIRLGYIYNISIKTGSTLFKNQEEGKNWIGIIVLMFIFWSLWLGQIEGKTSQQHLNNSVMFMK